MCTYIFIYIKGKTSEKIYQLDEHVFCVVSGMTADANYLIDYAR
jgi:20S proteasome alpha/beta subunit